MKLPLLVCARPVGCGDELIFVEGTWAAYSGAGVTAAADCGLLGGLVEASEGGGMGRGSCLYFVLEYDGNAGGQLTGWGFSKHFRLKAQGGAF